MVHLKLLFVAIVWGFGWPAGRVLAQDIAPFGAAWIRYVIAVGCFIIYLNITDNWHVPTKKEWKRITLIGFFSTFIYQSLFMYGMKFTAAGDPSVNGWIAIVFLAIFSTVFSYVWFADGIVTIGAGKTALYVYLVAPFGILGGWLILDEKLGWSLIASFLLILIGVLLAQSNPKTTES
jgi:drug/metabolite transporter (DMT)-like permease